ncbi:MAG: IS1 family transposase [Candidatus Kapaibacterium sp.]
MNKLTLAKRTQIIHCLVEGMSLRATTRIADVSINTVSKLLVDAGKACAAYQDETLRGLTCKRIQVDEIWSFVYAKQKNASDEMKEAGTAGDVWTWTAIDADTKLVPSWLVGSRDAECAGMFIKDLACRLSNRVQLTSDGLKTYLEAVDMAFGADIDYGMLVKVYGPEIGGDHRYSPAECTGAIKTVVMGKPDKAHISTSYVERQNLTMRMQMRRFTRLTNAFSKKVENHAHAVALHSMYYNFVRLHKTLRCSPAMEAGVTNHLWEVEDIAKLVP